MMSAYDDPDYADERIEELCGETIELAATIEKLRAELAAAQRTIDAQAATIKQAREAMLESKRDCDHEKEYDCEACDRLDAWLAANPA